MIETAQIKDADKIATLIKASINACVDDHHNDKFIIEQWSSNKTAENIKQWIEQNFAVSFKINDDIVGFLLMSNKGELFLNYVLPSHFHQGIGNALMANAIECCQQNHIQYIHLESTLTAKDFYLSKGFDILQPIYENEKIVAYEMQLEIR